MIGGALMKTNQPGNKDLPDFKQLNDRIIAEASSEPMLVIKTNQDPKDSTKNNPYVQKHGITDTERFRSYFEERNQ